MTTRLVLWAMVVAILLPFTSHTITVEVAEAKPIVSQAQLVRGFLESKQSPLAPETDFLMTQAHWKLLIAVSAIESQYCKRKVAFNCWGIGGDSKYQKYGSLREAIVAANALIEKWQRKGRWLTPEDMNCSYVQPCSPNWLRVVKQSLIAIDAYGRPNLTIPQ